MTMGRNNILLDGKGYLTFVDKMGDDNSPLISARMSTNNPTGMDICKDDKLRRYLWANGHTSPFESLVLSVEMYIPIFVLRQIDRHRTLDVDETSIESVSDFRSYSGRNEFSGRYSVMADDYYVPDLSRIAGEDVVNKQGSAAELTDFMKQAASIQFDLVCKESFEAYKHLLEDLKVSKELSRILLPLTQYTKVRISANFVNWCKFLKLRLDKHAQWEVQQYAIALEELIKYHWPKCYEVFYECSLNAVTIQGNEIAFLANLLDNDSNLRQWGIDQIGLKEAHRLFKKLGVKNWDNPAISSI